MIPQLPPPQTFAEGQRLIYGWLVAAAGICIGIAILVGGGVVAFADWGKDQYHFQLVILFTLLCGGTVIISFVIIGLLVGGPVGRFRGSVAAGDKSASIEADAPGTMP